MNQLLPRSLVLDINGGVEDPWLPAARQGERWALEQMYIAYQRPIYNFCYRLLGRTEDAEDATQATFVQAFRGIARFRGDSRLKTWLYRIARNESVNLLRKRPQTVTDLEECVASEALMNEQWLVRSVLGRVKPMHREILVLRFWEGLSYEEIAGVLGLSMSAVKMRLLRAKEEFRRWYQEAQ